MNVGQPVQAVWTLASENSDGTHAVYGVFSTPEKALATFEKLLVEVGEASWSRTFPDSKLGGKPTGEHLNQGEFDAISCDEMYAGDDPSMDFVATNWECRLFVLDQLVD